MGKYDKTEAVNQEKKDVRIVVLQRGWVVVGEYARKDSEITVSKASVIRRWGTSKGLGELVNGPLENTVLDPCGTVRANVIGEVFTMDCEVSKWADSLK